MAWVLDEVGVFDPITWAIWGAVHETGIIKADSDPSSIKKEAYHNGLIANNRGRC